jgi:xylulokinase
VAFALRDSLDLLSELGATVEVARVSGGGARSELWLQIVASVLELPLERVAVDEGAAFGAAILAGVGTGAWKDVHAATAATVRVGDTVEPVQEWIDVYRDRRERFRALYPVVKGNG